MDEMFDMQSIQSDSNLCCNSLYLLESQSIHLTNFLQIRKLKLLDESVTMFVFKKVLQMHNKWRSDVVVDVQFRLDLVQHVIILIKSVQ